MSKTEDNTITVKSLKRKETEYEDLGRIKFEELEEVLNLSNTARDKVAFTVFAMGIYSTFFLAAWVPKYFYIWYTVNMLYLMPHQWYSFKQHRKHYFMFEFCYFATVLDFIYLWAPSSILGDTIRGYMFPVLFAMTMGVVFVGIFAFNNALVLHSTAHMSMLFVHAAPAISMAGIQWYSTDEQGFPLCGNPTQPGPDGCDHVGVFELFFGPAIAYLIWLALFTLVVHVLLKRRIERKQNFVYSTYILKQRKAESYAQNLYAMFRPKYQLPLYYATNTVLVFLFLPLGYFCYHSAVFFVVMAVLIFAAGSYNGASFYVDVFSQHYYNKRVERKRRLSSLTKFN